MRAVLPWALGAVLTFVVVSSAFLLLANLGTEPGEVRLEPQSSTAGSNPPLEMRLDESRLEDVSRSERLNVQLRNNGPEDFSEVNLLVEVYSEDTAVPDKKLYRRVVRGLDVGDSADVALEMDLSTVSDDSAYPGSDYPRQIVEIRATTPGGVSDSRTVLLPVSDRS